MPEVTPIGSNLRQSPLTYDQELSLPPAQEAYYQLIKSRGEGKSTPEMIEAEQMAYEEAYRASEPQRWEKQDKWQGRENEEMRLTNILHPHAVFYKLQRAGVDARIEAPSFNVYVTDDKTGRPVAQKRERTNGRLWLHDDAIAGRVGVSAWVVEDGQRIRKCVTSLQYPYGPEWSVMRFDQWNVPTNERYRGWRTAMLSLILAGVLTEEEVDRAFGSVPLTDASYFYRRTLYGHRQRKAGLIQ